VTAVIEPVAASIRADASPVLDGAASAAFALQRGTAIHRLLQMLPDIEPQERAGAAVRYLRHVSGDWPQGEDELARASVMAILGDPVFGPVFAPGSRAEVELMGTLRVGGVERAVAGKIDRLCVGEDMVTIVDYKTNRPAPASFADVPPAYVLQLSLYAELLRPLYPRHRIAAALLFTDAPRLIPVAAEEMNAALARLGLS
jgi:ATP-dependent helicase/nuclease subunit A